MHISRKVKRSNFNALCHIACLGDRKVVCPRQLPNVNGEFYSIEHGNVIRLYEFIPGKILCDVPPSPNLFYHAGVYLGKLDETLKVKLRKENLLVESVFISLSPTI
jgi:Ser/Thr protein kinase RdoA (MazF antagonist)